MTETITGHNGVRKAKMKTTAPNTRRHVLRNGLAAVATSAAAMVAPHRVEAKVQPRVVNYIQETKNPNQNCGNCVNFILPSACKVVEGEIAVNGWCQVWAAAPKKPG